MGNEKFFHIINGNHIDVLQIILSEILRGFDKIGLDFDKIHRNIQNRTKDDVPPFCLAKENIGLEKDTIYLAVEDYSLWNQTVYQLSHELTHCFIHCHNEDKRFNASWIEETICEAVSMWFLAYFRDNWYRIPCYLWDSNYGNHFAHYLTDNLMKEYNCRLSNCKSYDELMDIEKTSQDRREDRRYEMWGLYRLLSENDIKGLICYRDYIICGSKILDTEKYTKDYPNNPAIEYLCNLQNSIFDPHKNLHVA